MPRWLIRDHDHPDLHYARGIYDAGPHDTGEATLGVVMRFYRKETSGEPSDRMVLSTFMGATQAVIIYPGGDFPNSNRICKLTHPIWATGLGLRGWDGISHAPNPPTLSEKWLPQGTRLAVVNWIRYGTPAQEDSP